MFRTAKWSPALSLLIALCAPAAHAGTYTAASCNQSDVNAVINGPTHSAVDGDVIQIPAGSCTWTTTLVVSGKSISLIGAGIGTTVITSGNGTTNGMLIDWTTKATGGNPAGFTRVSGFTFQTGVNCGGSDQSGFLLFRGASQNFRFDHNRVIESAGLGCAGLRVGIADGDGTPDTGMVFGVVDHNTFNDNGPLTHATAVNGVSYGGVGAYGDNSWASPPTWGTAKVLYFEDNTIVNGSGSDCFGTNDTSGARTSYRFNTFTDCSYSTHGTETNGRPRGFRHAEVHNNSITVPASNLPEWGNFRGGTGFVFNNNLSSANGQVHHVFSFNTYRSNDTWAGHNGSYVFGRCGIETITSLTRSGSMVTATVASNYAHPSGSYYVISGANQPEYNGTFTVHGVDATHFTYTILGAPASPATGAITARSVFDGNADSTGYRCLDQAGAGQSILYSGDGPSGPAQVTPLAPGQSALEPIYAWGNTFLGALDPINNSGGGPAVLFNRDVYVDNTSFTGTTGIGSGPRSSRPATCTKGVAWWATDQGTWKNGQPNSGVLDVCTAANTWTNAYYTPYTYPHPLIAGGSGTIVNPPTNLAATVQ